MLGDIAAKDELDEALDSLTLADGRPQPIPRAAKRARTCSLSPAHEAVASACWVYRVVIADPMISISSSKHFAAPMALLHIFGILPLRAPDMTTLRTLKI